MQRDFLKPQGQYGPEPKQGEGSGTHLSSGIFIGSPAVCSVAKSCPLWSPPRGVSPRLEWGQARPHSSRAVAAVSRFPSGALFEGLTRSSDMVCCRAWCMVSTWYILVITLTDSDGC